MSSTSEGGVPLVRQVLAIVLLPGTVVVPVPVLILARGRGPEIGWGLPDGLAVVPFVAGAFLMAAGFALWLRSVRLFAQIGKGTLAPWDPTRRLVVVGPYRYVRNPMISGVLGVLIGEAALFGSPALAAWCGVFFVMNAVWFVVYEEPGLVDRFGDEYRGYKRNVPRWIPRRTPWSPG
jgi:protein-S-isoprenylcysteine O-methyltransferase Ste14